MVRLYFLIYVLLFSVTAFGQQPLGPGAKVAWDLNTEPDVTEYELFSAATSGAQDLAGTPIATIAHPTSEWLIDTEGAHFMVLTAVDRFGNSSPPSNEVSFEFNSSPPAAPENLRIMFPDGSLAEFIMDENNNPIGLVLRFAEEPEQ